MDLKEAIKSLDPKVDGNWTEAGLPSLEAIKQLTGKSYSRKEVTEAEPLLTREKLVAGAATQVSTDPDADKDDTPEVSVEAKPEPDEEPREDLKAKLEARLEDTRRKRAEVEKIKAQVDAEQARLVALEDKLVEDLDKLQPPHSTTHDIQLYLARQHEQRVARAEKADPRSDLDRSLQGRRRAARDRL